MAFVMHVGCTSKGLVDYPWSTCLSVGAATSLNLGAESWRRCFEAFAQFIAGTPLLWYIGHAWVSPMQILRWRSQIRRGRQLTPCRHA